MAHLRPPTSLRVGKTYPWKSNVLLPRTQISSHLISGDLGLSQGLDLAIDRMLIKSRIFVVKGNLKLSEKTNTLYYYMLYSPRMKQLPLDHIKAAHVYFDKHIYGARPFNRYFTKKNIRYGGLRRFRLAPQAYKPGRTNVNAWITSRMFRGSRLKKWYYKPLTKKKLKSTVWSRQNIKRLTKYIQKRYFKRRQVFKLGQTRFRARPIWSKSYTSGRPYKFRKNNENFYRLTNRYLSKLVSNITIRNCKVKALNVFSYLAKKRLIHYWTHQEHFWVAAYRSKRFKYANYYDIINAFYLMGMIPHTEKLIISIFKLMLSRIWKLRRFFYFIDSILKKMPHIRKAYICFRILIVGKLSGGTKRTKNMSIGYGRYPIQSFDANVTNNFMNFTHKFGEFGIHFVMWRARCGIKTTIYNKQDYYYTQKQELLPIAENTMPDIGDYNHLMQKWQKKHDM